MVALLNVDAAIAEILKQTEPLGSEVVSIERARGRILAKTVRADIDLPPFASSAVDGYAVRSEDVVGASEADAVTLRVVMDIPAGTMTSQTLGAGEAGRIMTGAPLPSGADCVVMVEDTDSYWEKAHPEALPEVVSVFTGAGLGQNVRPIGENVRAGEIILNDGDELNAASIGMLAALGIGEVAVVKQARVAILSSGDELVGIGDALTPGKIRDVNRYTLRVMCEEMGAEAICLPRARDSAEAIEQMFMDALALKPDVIVSSAGVSVGAVDFTRDVLMKLGKVNLWRINLRPGKPLVFGEVRGVPFFGLPGNPVSAMVTFEVLVRPALAKMMGRAVHDIYLPALTGHAIQSDGRRSYLRVRLSYEDGQWVAYETGTQSSGALMSMVRADGLLIVPEDVKYVEANEMMKVKLLRPLRDIDA